jgi:hypothetical protein
MCDNDRVLYRVLDVVRYRYPIRYTVDSSNIPAFVNKEVLNNWFFFRVFKKEKQQPSEEDKAKKREKYLNSKKPNRFETPLPFYNTHFSCMIATV